MDVLVPQITMNGAPVISCSYENAVNSGIKWSAKVLGVRDISGGVIDCTISADGWASPPLTATDSEYESLDDRGIVGITSYSGTDRTSYLLGMEGLSSPTIHDASGSDLINMICQLGMTSVSAPGATSVSISNSGSGWIVSYVSSASGRPVTYTRVLSGLPPSPIPVRIVGPLASMRVEDFDIQGGGIGEYIVRLARDAGCNYRIDHGGTMVIWPTQYAGSGENSLPHSVVHRKRQLANKYTQVWCKKTSKSKAMYGFHVTTTGMHTGDLGNGLTNWSISVTPDSIGSVAYVAFFENSGGGGRLVGYQACGPNFAVGGSQYAGVSALIGVPIPGIPAKSCVFAVEPAPFTTMCDLTLIVRGRPPGAYNYDPTFVKSWPADTIYTDPVSGIEYVVANGDTSARPRKLVVDSPAWPTYDFLTEDILLGILTDANKPTDTVSAVVKWDPRIEPGDYYKIGSLPSARYDSVSWSLGSDGISMSMTGWVNNV